jgi:hypothetical protein
MSRMECPRYYNTLTSILLPATGIVSNLALLTAVQVLVFMCLERSRGVEPRPLVWRTNVQPFHLLRLLPAP